MVYTFGTTIRSSHDFPATICIHDDYSYSIPVLYSRTSEVNFIQDLLGWRPFPEERHHLVKYNLILAALGMRRYQKNTSSRTQTKNLWGESFIKRTETFFSVYNSKRSICPIVFRHDTRLASRILDTRFHDVLHKSALFPDSTVQKECSLMCRMCLQLHRR